jgi:hypothetical protein
MESAEMKAVAPFVLAAVVAYLLYAGKTKYAMYAALGLAAWLGYDFYEKKSAEVAVEA